MPSLRLPRPGPVLRALRRVARHAALLLAALAAPAAAARGQAPAPVVDKVDPPTWWAGHSINPVRLLVRGRHLAGARFECARVRCAAVRVNAAGTYAFVDVEVPRGTSPGRYPLTLRTPGGAASVPFAVAAPLARAGRFRGFDANDVLYLIMPDRFANGDTANDDPAASRGLRDRRDPRRYHGGDLAGVRARLPYLKELGVTAIWLNPIYDNTEPARHVEVADGRPTTAYHGYHAIDYYGVEERFGDLGRGAPAWSTRRTRRDQGHLDMVANHTSAYHPWVDDSPTPTWYNGTRRSHLANTFQGWTIADPYSPPRCGARRSTAGSSNFLPDLNQGDPEVARYLIQNTLWWVGARASTASGRTPGSTCRAPSGATG
jgi:hypothetical protein